MTIVNGYVSVTDVREHIEDGSSVVPVALIERAVNGTSRAIDNYCGYPRRRFWKDPAPTSHVYVTPDPYCRIWIDDVASKAGLTVQVDDGSGTFPTTWTPADYRLGPVNADANGPAFAWTWIEPTGTKAWPTLLYGQPSVKITGIHGWSEVPDEVENACLIKTVSLLKRKEAPFGVAGFGEFGTAVRIRAEDPDVVDLLKHFIRYGAGSTG